MAGLSSEVDIEDLRCDCDEDDQCCDDGCLFRIKVGPCSALDRSSGNVNMDLMCTPKNATAHTPNFIRPLREKTYRNSCRKQRKRGTPDCNIDIDFEICATDPALKYLLSDCPVALCIVPRIDLFDESTPIDQQPGVATITGLFIGGDWSWNNEFEECQATSRNFSCTGKVFGFKSWLDSIPTPTPLDLSDLNKAAELTLA